MPVSLSCSRNVRSRKNEEGAARCPSCSRNAHIQKVLAWDKSASRRAQGWAGENVVRSKGQLRPLPPILEKRGRGKRKGPGDSLCSRNARSRTPLVGRAHGGKPPGRPSRLGRGRKAVYTHAGIDRLSQKSRMSLFPAPTLNGSACYKGSALLLGELACSAERRSLSWPLGWRSPHALIDLAEMVFAPLSGAIR